MAVVKAKRTGMELGTVQALARSGIGQFAVPRSTKVSHSAKRVSRHLSCSGASLRDSVRPGAHQRPPVRSAMGAILPSLAKAAGSHPPLTRFISQVETGMGRLGFLLRASLLLDDPILRRPLQVEA